MIENEEILRGPLKDIGASQEFIEMCKKNDFIKLADILELHVNEMLKKPDFNHRMLKELYKILEKNGLTYQLKEL
jgi:DNA-directed RNA polymerase alpha subunit